MQTNFLLGTIKMTEPARLVLKRQPYDLIARHAVNEHGHVTERELASNMRSMTTLGQIISRYKSDPTNPRSKNVLIVMAASGAAGSFVVTSGRFTKEATAFASGRNVKLLDGPRLHELIKLAQTTPVGAESSMTGRSQTAKTIAAPTCPLCARPMVRRVVKRGSTAGSTFWGCSGFPSCHGTSNVGTPAKLQGTS